MTVQHEANEYVHLVRGLLGRLEDRSCIGVTSTLSGEGVTSTCVGLAWALAESSAKRVLLVDANLRRPRLHDWFRLERGPGLAEVVAGRRDLGSAIRHSALPNLYILPAGEQVDRPGHVLGSAEMAAVLSGLRRAYNCVLVDCPSILGGVDAAYLSRVLDGIALVVRAGVTPRNAIGRACLSLNGARLLGVVLNGAD